jgi:hypothetical protein
MKKLLLIFALSIVAMAQQAAPKPQDPQPPSHAWVLKVLDKSGFECGWKYDDYAAGTYHYEGPGSEVDCLHVLVKMFDIAYRVEKQAIPISAIPNPAPPKKKKHWVFGK